MKHCGNKPSAKTGDKILSLREPKGEFWQPHATFVVNNGVLGEMKGYDNKKPGPELHKYIIPLLEDERIERLKGGTYLRENDFKLEDLTDRQFKMLEKKRPELVERSKVAIVEQIVDQINSEGRWWDEYFSENEENWIADHVKSASSMEEHEFRLEKDAEELVEKLKKLVPEEKKWKQILVDCSDLVSGDSGAGLDDNTLNYMSVGEQREEFSDQLKDMVNSLTDEQREALIADLPSEYCDESDLNDYRYMVGDPSSYWALVLDVEVLEERLEELEAEAA